MPVPEPKPDESKDDFMERCVSFLIDEGTDNEQAVAICYNQWRERDKMSNEMIFKYLTEKAEKVDKRVLRFVGSDEKVDRSGDIIKLDGWDLKAYKKNPVVLFAHRHHDVPVARTKRVWIDKTTKQLLFDIEFPEPEVSSVGDSLYKLYKSGFMKATSVGFMPDYEKIEYPERKKSKGPSRIFNQQELLELSLVSVPDNPRALFTGKSMEDAIEKDIIDKLELQELLDYCPEGVCKKEKVEEEKKNTEKDKVVELETEISILKLQLKEQEIEEEDDFESYLGELFDEFDQANSPEEGADVEQTDEEFAEEVLNILEENE